MRPALAPTGSTRSAYRPGASRALRFRFFVGPKDLSLLGAQAADLDEAVEYGIFGLFAIGLLWVLKIFHMGVGNWGVSIVLLTLLVTPVSYAIFDDWGRRLLRRGPGES